MCSSDLEELASAVASVARRLALTDTSIPVPLAGGIFREVPRVRRLVLERLHAILPAAAPALLTVEPATGARHLATALLHGEVRVPVYLDTTH